MSQTRKQRPQRAQPRRLKNRDAAIGSLTLGALWALAAQTDRGGQPEPEGVATIKRPSDGNVPETPDTTAQSTSALPAAVSALNQELLQLVASLAQEASSPRVPALAPSPEAPGLSLQVDGPTEEANAAG